MIRLDRDLGTPVPFRYIGGQDMAVATLKAAAEQEMKGTFAGRKPLILLEGPAGTGKTTVLKETSRLLGGGLVIKKVNDLISSPKDLLRAIEGGYDEARFVASKAGSKKAVYGLESLDTVLKMGEPHLISECMANIMTTWSEDLDGGVLFVATAFNSSELLPPVLTRFTVAKLKRPDNTTALDVIVKGMERLSNILQRIDIFEDLEDEHALDLAKRVVILGWSARDVTNFLRSSIAFSDQEQRGTRIDYTFLVSKMPSLAKRTGF